MALEPCKVCGSLTSMEVDYCPHCGYPPTGRKRSPIFIWTARILAFAVITSLLLSLLNLLNLLRFFPIPNSDPFDDRDRGDGVAFTSIHPQDRAKQSNTKSPKVSLWG